MDMNAWLQANGHAPNAGMRNRIINAGFGDQASFVRKKEDDIKRALSVIRKSPAAVAARDVSMRTEERLIKLMYFTIMWHKTGRAMEEWFCCSSFPANQGPKGFT